MPEQSDPELLAMVGEEWQKFVEETSRPYANFPGAARPVEPSVLGWRAPVTGLPDEVLAFAIFQTADQMPGYPSRLIENIYDEQNPTVHLRHDGTRRLIGPRVSGTEDGDSLHELIRLERAMRRHRFAEWDRDKVPYEMGEYVAVIGVHRLQRIFSVTGIDLASNGDYVLHLRDPLHESAPGAYVEVAINTVLHSAGSSRELVELGKIGPEEQLSAARLDDVMTLMRSVQRLRINGRVPQKFRLEESESHGDTRRGYSFGSKVHLYLDDKVLTVTADTLAFEGDRISRTDDGWLDLRVIRDF